LRTSVLRILHAVAGWILALQRGPLLGRGESVLLPADRKSWSLSWLAQAAWRHALRIWLHALAGLTLARLTYAASWLEALRARNSGARMTALARQAPQLTGGQALGVLRALAVLALPVLGAGAGRSTLVLTAVD
jgi:hypothetical protein